VKITKESLKRIITEEIKSVLEGRAGWDPYEAEMSASSYSQTPSPSGRVQVGAITDTGDAPNKQTADAVATLDKAMPDRVKALHRSLIKTPEILMAYLQQLVLPSINPMVKDLQVKAVLKSVAATLAAAEEEGTSVQEIRGRATAGRSPAALRNGAPEQRR